MSSIQSSLFFPETNNAQLPTDRALLLQQRKTYPNSRTGEMLELYLLSIIREAVGHAGPSQLSILLKAIMQLLLDNEEITLFDSPNSNSLTVLETSITTVAQVASPLTLLLTFTIMVSCPLLTILTLLRMNLASMMLLKLRPGQ